MKSRITERNAIAKAKAKKCYLLHFESSFNPISDNDYNFIVILYFTIVLHAFLKITNILGPKCSVKIRKTYTINFWALSTWPSLPTKNC